jgi:phosphoenolpyruvate carboxykinase (ATP)
MSAVGQSLNKLGFRKNGCVSHQLSADELYQQALDRHEARASRDGALVILTGPHTGRLPQAKFFVRDALTEAAIDWGKVNRAVEPEKFDAILDKTLRYLETRDLFIQDAAAGADPSHRISLRLVTESAVHALFAHWMFIRTPACTREDRELTILHAPSLNLDPVKDGLGSEAFILIHFSRKLILIGGTAYAGEIKKAVFTWMNFLLPGEGVLPLHSSANFAPGSSETALFFGLSGTGKTTLSADHERVLIGDDEHGWGANGIFNIEGGCYAKAIRLSAQSEPEIFAAVHRRGTILENVVMDTDGNLNLESEALTENTRAAYPVDFMPHMTLEGRGGHPRHILMLACDAFGVLPPVSRLTPDQAVYHFLSGYTAKVAGTEEGLKTPQATFSACFGAPFMPRPTALYASLLRDRISQYQTRVWLLNTGWIGGAYGEGRRIPLGETRGIVKAILSGEMDKASFQKDPLFRAEVPKHCPGVSDQVLDQKSLWRDSAAYEKAARQLALMFKNNFAATAHANLPGLDNAGPVPA